MGGRRPPKFVWAADPHPFVRARSAIVLFPCLNNCAADYCVQQMLRNAVANCHTDRCSYIFWVGGEVSYKFVWAARPHTIC
jgi:hypothetical protein